MDRSGKTLHFDIRFQRIRGRMPSTPPPAPEPVSPHYRRSKPPFQFSLKTLMWVVTGSAVVLGLGVSLPEWGIRLLGTVFLSAQPAALTAGLIYGRNNVRAFCLGGLFPAFVAMAALVFGSRSYFSYLLGSFMSSARGSGRAEGVLALAFMILPPLISTVATGFLCVWIRRVLLRWREK